MPESGSGARVRLSFQRETCFRRYGCAVAGPTAGRPASSRQNRETERMSLAKVLVAAGDAKAAEWVMGGVRDFDGTVGSIVPSGFGAYARVFHPAGLVVLW
jgi:hypothetical protein